MTNRRAILKAAAALAGTCSFADMQAQQVEEKTAQIPKAFTVSAEKSRQGDPLLLRTGESVECKVSGSDTNGQNAIFEMTIPAGTGSLLHLHPDQDEWWYVLTGEFVFQVGTEKFNLEPGASLFGPRATPHAFRSIGSMPGKLLVVFQPAGSMEEFYAVYAKIRVLPPRRLLRILYSQHGMKLVGPAISVEHPPAS